MASSRSSIVQPTQGSNHDQLANSHYVYGKEHGRTSLVNDEGCEDRISSA
jgi:hypothetical protein